MFRRSPTKFIHFIKTRQINNLRFLNTKVNTTSLFVNILGLKDKEAENFVKKHNIDALEPKRLKNTLQFIKRQKYSFKEVIKNPRLFELCSYRTWQQYYDYLKECGCTNIPLSNLIKFRTIRYTTIKDLKSLKVLPEDANVVQNLVNQLDISFEDDEISDLNNNDLTLSYVHRAIIHRYLIKRLGATTEDLEKINRIHNCIYNKSLKKFCENLNIALEIGFSKEKILRNPYILQVNPENTKEILEKIPNFLNCDMKSQMKRFPKLIGLSMEHINSIYDILKQNMIEDETITKTMNIFTLSAYTVAERLADIKSTPETRVLMNNPQTLRLILHYHRANDRLQFLHKYKLKCSSLLVIGFDAKVFDNYIKEGKDMNARHEIGDFLGALLNACKTDVDVNIKKHPYYLYVPFVEIEDTYFFLKKLRFEDAHLLRAITILLYPKDKIVAALQKIKEDHYLSTRKPRANKVHILNLALYYLEKDHHFKGNGIWRVNDDYAP